MSNLILLTPCIRCGYKMSVRDGDCEIKDIISLMCPSCFLTFSPAWAYNDNRDKAIRYQEMVLKKHSNGGK